MHRGQILALSNFEDYCTGDRSHFPAVEELYKTAPVGDGVNNVNENSTVEFSNVSQVADSLTNCENSFLVAQQGLFFPNAYPHPKLGTELLTHCQYQTPTAHKWKTKIRQRLFLLKTSP